MKTRRFVNRRDFNVGTAGWFTVLRPNARPAAPRLPGGFHNLGHRSEAVPQAASPAQEGLGAPTNQTTLRLHALNQAAAEPHHLVRSALMVLAATAITLFLLWWIFVRPHPVW